MNTRKALRSTRRFFAYGVIVGVGVAGWWRSVVGPAPTPVGVDPHLARVYEKVWKATKWRPDPRGRRR